MVETWLWIVFGVVTLVMLSLDLGILNRKAHAIGFREAVVWTIIWIALAMAFNAAIWHWQGGDAALKFLAGYLIEKSLSVDNIFVFLMIFSYFATPAKFQHRVLFWGVIGALVLRAIMIGCGVALIERFQWIIYVFGGFLVLTGIKMAFKSDEQIHPERNIVLRLFRRIMPITSHYSSRGRFLIRRGGKLIATPLLVVLLVVETSDVVFAVDSIPAIFGITHDPFIIYTSNIFAILGLRSLYFVLAGVMRLFHLLHYGLSAILAFIGIKMLLPLATHLLGGLGLQTPIWMHEHGFPIGWALGTVAFLLAVSVAASLIWPVKAVPPATSPQSDEDGEVPPAAAEALGATPPPAPTSSPQDDA